MVNWWIVLGGLGTAFILGVIVTWAVFRFDWRP